MSRELDWVMELPDNKMLTTTQVARILGAGQTSVIRWIKQGKIFAIRSPGGWYKIPAWEVKRILRESGYGAHEPELKRILREWRASASKQEDRGDK